MTTASSPETARRQVMLTASALLALTAAAYEHGVNDTAYDPEEPETKTAKARFESLRDDTLEILGIVSRESEAFRAMLDRPKTIGEAINRVLGIERLWTLANGDYLDKLDAWQRADDQGARIRVGVVARLQKPLADGGAGMSYSAADKAASGDPEYTGHKDHTAALAAAKNEAEIERDTALHAMLNARAVLKAMTQGESITINVRESEAVIS